jgi:hypothetical protein
VAGAPDSLLRWLVSQFVSSSCRDGQDSFPLGLLFGCGFILVFIWQLPLRVPRTFLTALVFTVRTRLLRPVDGSTAMATTVDTHSDRLLHTLHSRLWSGCGNPVVRVECEPILCKECARSLLLQCMAIELFRRRGGRWRRIGSGGDRNLRCGRRTEICQCDSYYWS